MAGDGGWRQRVNPNALLITAAVTVATIAIGAGIAVYLNADSDGDARASEISTSDSTSTSRPAASSTTTTSTTTTSAPGGITGTGGTQDPGRFAYSDPDDEPYEPVPTAAGVSATVEACSWSPDNGGELQASGTLRSAPDADDFWIVEVYWLQNDRELDSQSDFFDLAPGASIPWRLTLPAPLPPAEPFRCALEVD
jgi:hypothetical protein